MRLAPPIVRSERCFMSSVMRDANLILRCPSRAMRGCVRLILFFFQKITEVCRAIGEERPFSLHGRCFASSEEVEMDEKAPSWFLARILR